MKHKSLFVEVQAKPGKRDELASVLSRIGKECQSEPGTLMYIMNFDATDSDRLWFYELYDDEAAFQAHLAHRDTMVDLNNELEELIAGEAKLIETEAIEGIGLPA